MSISLGEWRVLSSGYVMRAMQTVFETRRARLGLLIKQHGSIAAVNRALGLDETNARLYQIHNRSVRKDRGTLYEMGDVTAREIEAALSLPTGWMDTPPSYEDLLGPEDPRQKLLLLMDNIPKEQWPTVVRLVDALREHPRAANGD